MSLPAEHRRKARRGAQGATTPTLQFSKLSEVLTRYGSSAGSHL